MKEKPIKVMTVVGTRPEVIRLSRVIDRLHHSEAIEHILVHTGQNYDYTLNEIFLKIFKFHSPIFFWKRLEKMQHKLLAKL